TGLLGGFPVLNSSTTFFEVATGSKLTITGPINNNIEVIKRGGGTLEFAGVTSNGYNANTRILAGTLLLNKEPGVPAMTGGTIFVGDDQGGANADVLLLGGSDQIPDGVTIQVNSSGLFNLNNNADVTNQINLVIGSSSAGNIVLGTTGILTLNNNLTVFT